MYVQHVDGRGAGEIPKTSAVAPVWCDVVCGVMCGYVSMYQYIKCTCAYIQNKHGQLIWLVSCLFASAVILLVSFLVGVALHMVSLQVDLCTALYCIVPYCIVHTLRLGRGREAKNGNEK